MIVAVILVIGLGIGWMLQAQITRALTRPLGASLYYSSPTGGLDFVMTLSICVGALLALPFAIYHFLKYIEPISAKPLTRNGMRIVLISFALAIAGGLFAYFVTLPGALNFLKSFNKINVNPLLSAKEYLTFAMTYIFTFAIIFQLPLIIGSINRMKPLQPKKLFKKQRWVVLASFIIAAFATPTPDPMNQSIMALPLIVLFNVSILVVWIQNSVSKARTSKAHTQAKEPIPTTLSAIPSHAITPSVEAPKLEPVTIGPPTAIPATQSLLDLRSDSTLPQTPSFDKLNTNPLRPIVRDISIAKPA